MPRESQQAKKKRAAEIMAVLRKSHPDAKCALNHRTPLQLLVATILSAQCTDVRVNIVTRDLFAKYKTTLDYADAPQEVLQEEIRSTGFFRNKAKSIKACCETLLEVHEGELPRDIDALVDLPGVGRKTANV
ncbi:MAG: endonuclease III, partial [Planctomycetes bacterium]|nr:endonuclease III [Planctomycetota bacterium]